MAKDNSEWGEISLDDITSLTKEVINNGPDHKLDTTANLKGSRTEEEDEIEIASDEGAVDTEDASETGDDKETEQRVKDDAGKRDVSSSEERIKTLYAANKQNEEKVALLEQRLREREEALNKAKQSESTLRKGELEYRKSSLESETASIEKAIEDARSEGDVKLETQLFKKLQTKIIEQKLLESSISDFEETATPKVEDKRSEPKVEAPVFPEEATKFVNNNPWIAQDAGARDIVARAAQTLIDKGVDPNSKAFYDRLAPMLEKTFTAMELDHKVVHEGRETRPELPKTAPKVKSPILGKETASDETSTFVRSSDGKVKAKVTSDDKEMAQRLGMPLKAYMESKYKTEKQTKGNVGQWAQIEGL